MQRLLIIKYHESGVIASLALHKAVKIIHGDGIIAPRWLSVARPRMWPPAKHMRVKENPSPRVHSISQRPFASIGGLTDDNVIAHTLVVGTKARVRCIRKGLIS